MKNSVRTIQILLLDGDPTSIRSAEDTTGVLRVFDIPRNQLNKFFSRKEASQVGIYFLLGENEGNEQKIAYIGQSQDLKTRINQHSDKEFWNRVIVVVSLTNNLTQTHALFLESLAIESAKSADRFKLENANSGSLPYAPEPLAADCHLFFELINILVSTLGCPIFKPLVNAKGILTDEGFVVLKGSIGKEEVTHSDIEQRRAKLLETGVAFIENNQLVFQKDYLFNTPSGASCVLLGRSSNGWVDWKDESDRTLNEVKRLN
jgi:predicted GIY-YIG superfamily endonuclease